MKTRESLFTQNQGIPAGVLVDARMKGEESAVTVSPDAELTLKIDAYLERFREISDIIEAKGKLIEYIRKAR